MKIRIQVIENPDRFHVSEDSIPVYTFLFGNGIAKEFAQMNANSEAYKLAVKRQTDGFSVKLLPQQSK